MEDTGGQGEIRVTTSLGQDFHLRIHTTESPARRIRERKISVHEGIARPIGTFLHRQAAVARYHPVAELGQHAPCVLGGIRL